MKATVTITSRGVVTLPAKLRQALGLKADDQLIAETTPEGLLLRPAVTLPLEVYTPQREREFDEAEADLAAVLACADCLVAFADDGTLVLAMPGMESSLWVKDLVKIEVKYSSPQNRPVSGWGARCAPQRAVRQDLI